jgi:dihydroorotate dehydrogenase (NAD+) catalytic subunit
LAGPLIGASGVFGYGTEYADLLDFGMFGGVVAKTVTLEPWEGNPPPRVVDVGCGVINSIGLENVGLEEFMGVVSGLDLPCRLIASIGGRRVEEYRVLAGRLDHLERIDALEVNVSCPNVESGGLAFGGDPEAAAAVVSGVRRETGRTLLVKIPPLVVGLEPVVEAVAVAGADALTLANTYPAMAMDRNLRRPVLGNAAGGLSGRAIKPMTLLLVWKTARAFDLPIAASGGIETAADAIDYVLAGAAALEIGSVVFRDLDAPARILEGLAKYMDDKGYSSIEEMRGDAWKEDKIGRG